MSFSAELQQAAQGLVALTTSKPDALAKFTTSPDAFWRAFWRAYVPASMLWILPAPLLYIETLGTVALTVAIAQLIGSLVAASALIEIARKRAPALSPLTILVPLAWLAAVVDLAQFVVALVVPDIGGQLALNLALYAGGGLLGWRILTRTMKMDGWVGFGVLVALTFLGAMMSSFALLLTHLV